MFNNDGMTHYFAIDKNTFNFEQ